MIDSHPKFEGFDIPEQNWFRLPNSWTDITRQMKSLAELKVVEYVLRHSWGYREYGVAKRISINEFMNGRRRKDGSRIDGGTGLSNRSVIDGLRNAVKHGFLIEEIDDRDRGRIRKHYLLKMRTGPYDGDDDDSRGGGSNHPINTDTGSPANKVQPGVKNLHRGVKNLHINSEESSHRSEKDTSDQQLSVNVNGRKHPVTKLPDLDEPPENTRLIAADILSQLGDRQSERFYEIVATKVPGQVIYQTLSQIKAFPPENPAAVFTKKMEQFALGQIDRREATPRISQMRQQLAKKLTVSK